jgi:hypothetical protein
MPHRKEDRRIFSNAEIAQISAWYQDDDPLHTARWIGRQYGVTKHTIIGKMCRLKVKAPRKPADTPRKPYGPRKRKPKPVPVGEFVYVSPSKIPEPLPIPAQIDSDESEAHPSIIDLRANQCRYALTEDPPHVFCGKHAWHGSPWCPEHKRMVYTRGIA